jgi:glycosyltransferase involved in cell wall biosynthesis
MSGPVVAVNATILNERPTGLGVYALGLIPALAALGERLRVITSHRAGIDGAVEFEPAPASLRPERRRGHVRRVLWLQSALPLRLARMRPDVLFNLVPEGPLLSPVPQVTLVHDLIPLFYPSAGRFPRAHLYFRHVVPRLLRASGAVLVNSEHTRSDVLRHFAGIDPDRVHVIYAGYDSTRFRPPAGLPEAHPPYLLYVGNVAPHKDLPRLIDAFAAATAGTFVRLLIRGWGHEPHRALVLQRIRARGLEGRVDWQAYEPYERLPGLYAGASALLLPSQYEGFGFTALEAMACGTPVIAARSTSIPEVVGDAGLLIEPRDEDGFADAIRRVLGDPVLAADLRARGPARAALFSWGRTAALARPHLDAVARGS